MFPSGMPQATQQATKCEVVPAPNGGINQVDMLAATPQFDSIYQYNIIPNVYGCKVRKGIKAWADTIAASTRVGTIMGYGGTTSSQDRMFAAARAGIYNVTTPVSNPASLIAFPTQDTTSGIGGWTAMVTAGGHFLIYCDESNGYYNYSEGGAWAKVTLGGGGTQISGVDPNNLVWPCVFKTRLWFVEKNTSNAWYLAPDSVFGAATRFQLANKFIHGGYLVGLYAWTLDGGSGIDDYLVAVSSAGDVLIFQGTDPAVATSFSLVGSWFIGSIPAGRRIINTFGGDLYILSAYGLLPFSKLIAGILIQNETEYLTRKVSPLITSFMTDLRLQQGWEVVTIPNDNLLLIAAPPRTGYPNQQLVQSLNTQGWAIYRGLPYFTGGVYNGVFYIGDTAGNVYKHDGTDDLGQSISWDLLTSYQEYDETGHYHRVQFIRPVFLTQSAPAYSVSARYDYNLDEIINTVPPVAVSGGTWDNAFWDADVWSGVVGSSSSVRGGSGLGRAMAIAINGNSVTEVTLLRFDLMFDTGGLM